MERINKATLFVNLLFFGTKKEEIYKNRLRLGVAVLFLEYTFVFRERKDINYNANAIEIKSPMLLPSIAIPASCGFSSLYRPFAAPFRA